MPTLALMLQIVPPTISPDPAAAPDPVTVVSELMRQIADAAVPQVHAAGMGMWRGLAAILIVWTGIADRFHGRFPPVGNRPDRHWIVVSVGDAHLLRRAASGIDLVVHDCNHRGRKLASSRC